MGYLLDKDYKGKVEELLRSEIFNRALQNKIEKIVEQYPEKTTKVFDYVNFMYELISISDYVITKGGPATIFEILLMGKIPIINTYMWEQEKGNVQFVVNNGIGFYEPINTKLAKLVVELFRHPEIAEAIDRKRKRLRLRNGTPEVAKYIVDL